MLLFIDTETTGLPKYYASDAMEKWPRIVQLAWSLYDNDGNRQSENSFIIYPTDFIVPMDSAKIHGITTERAKQEGISLYKVLPQFNDDVEKAMIVIAHNLDFDLPNSTHRIRPVQIGNESYEETKFLHNENPENCFFL